MLLTCLYAVELYAKVVFDRRFDGVTPAAVYEYFLTLEIPEGNPA